MALLDDKPRILAALGALPNVKAALPDWPESWQKLPCVVVTESANQAAEYRDDEEHITELEYYVRVFARSSADRAVTASAVDDTMRELGYRRTFAWEEENNGGGVRQKAMRYRKYFSIR